MSASRLAALAALAGPALIPLFLPSLAAQEQYPKLSPFAAVRWKGATPEVQVNQGWYELLALNDLEAKAIVEFCKKTYSDLWQKRFEEDLVEVLTRMGHKPGATVKLKVRPLDAKDARVLERVPMTKENRNALWKARLEAEQKAGPAKRPERPAGRAGGPRRVQREHAGTIPAEYQFLRNPVAFGTAPGAPALSRRQAAEDLDELEWHLEHRYSYLQLRKVDYRAALDAVRAGLGAQVSRDAFAVQLMKVLALFGDGHTRVNDWPLPAGYAPFLVGEAEGRLVAFRPDRSGFVEAEYPFLKRLDGVDVEKWLEAAARLGPGGSPPALRRQSVQNLRYVQYLRSELGLKVDEVLRLELESADAKRTRAVAVRVTRDRPASPRPQLSRKHRVRRLAAPLKTTQGTGRRRPRAPRHTPWPRR